MKIHAKNIRGKLWDLDTNQEIMRPIWFDVEAGLFEAFQTDAFGRIKKTRLGDSLTYMAKGRIKFAPTKIPEVLRRITQFGAKCMLCTRDAKWQVSDETPLMPARRGNLLMGRARVVAVRRYCDFCYKAPRVLDHRGEVMETIEDGGGVRPQWHS